MTNRKENSQPDILAAHSLVERHFYLMARRCGRCSRGPFQLVESQSDQSDPETVDNWLVRCKSCDQQEHVLFDRQALLVESAGAKDSLPVVNPSDQRSKIIDLAQWMALFLAIIEAAAGQSDKAESRGLGYEATLCLDEALKFYQPDSDLPPAEAFFTAGTLASFREHPEKFTRGQIIQLRSKLPSFEHMKQAMQKDSGKRPSRWWRRLAGKFRPSGR